VRVVVAAGSVLPGFRRSPLAVACGALLLALVVCAPAGASSSTRSAAQAWRFAGFPRSLNSYQRSLGVVTGSITPGGSAVTVTISNSGDTAELSFSGTANQRVSLQMTNNTMGWSFLSVVNPDGSNLNRVAAFQDSKFMDTMTLGSTGTYKVRVEPGNTGSMVLQLYDVPADPSGTIATDGTPITASTTVPGQNLKYTFSGTQGQRVFLNLTGISLGGGFEVAAIRNPNGSDLAGSGAIFGSSGFVDTTTLGTSGTFSVFVDPQDNAVGSNTLSLYNVPADASGALTIGGAPVTATVTTPGQGIAYTFSGGAGQPVHLSWTANTIQAAVYHIEDANGNTVAGTPLYSGSDGSLDANLPTTGTYKVTVNPYGPDTGQVTFNLTQSAPYEPIEQTYGPCDDGLDALNQSGCDGDNDTVNGAYTTSAKDVALPDIGIPFAFVRSYTSADPTAGRLGPGWTDSYAASLAIQPNGDVLLHSETGQQLYYTKQQDGSFTAAAGGLSTLSSMTGGYELVDHDQVHLRFDSQGKLTSVKDRNSEGVTLSYDGNGRLASISDSASRTISFSSNTDGTLSRVSLPDGRHVDYGYTAGRLTSVTDLRGGSTTYTYDSGGRLATIVDQNNHTVVTNTYDTTTGRLTSQKDALNNTTGYSWDAGGQVETITDARGHTSKDTYKGNLLIKHEDQLGHTTQYGYDSDLNQTSVTDPRNNQTSFTYDTRHNMLTRTTPLTSESWTYTAKNDVLTHTDARSNTISYGYDSAGNLTSKTEPGSIVTGYGRDPAGTGLLVSTTDPRNKTTSYGYDSAGNLTSITTPLGEKTTMGYDSSGRMTSKVDPRGNVTGCGCASQYTTSYAYNNADQKTSQTDPLNHTTSWAYDPAGNLSSVTDANNHATGYGYDAANRLTAVTAPDTSVTSYGYDADNNLTSRTDAKNHTTSYGYDNANRLTSTTNPQITSPATFTPAWSYGYDNNGNRTSMVDPNGATTSYGYDALNRLTSISYSGGASTPSVSYGYDGNGNRTSMNDGDGSIAYTYDALNRLTGATRTHSGGGTDSFSYSYDAAGNLTSRTYPGSTSTSYTPDDDERLASVTNGSATTNYTYTAAGEIKTVATPDGYTETRSYDTADRLTQITTANGGTTLATFSYTLDSVGNATQVSGTNPASYGYDSRDRLTSVCFSTGSCSTPDISWTYDAVGNRLTETRSSGTTSYTYNEDDQLLSDGSTSYSYDHNGNQTAAGSRTFGWDAANRPVSTTLSGTTTSYSYDGDGNRLTAATGSTTTNYLWDTNNPLAQLALERDGSGSVLRTYIQGPNTIALKTGGAAYYYHYDRLGSVVALTNASGQPEWTYSYEPFGGAKATTQNDPNAPVNPLQYAGQYQDAASGLYDLRARQYDPTSGRFLSIDPLANGLTTSLQSAYSYADDSPVNSTDPTGAIAQPTSVGVGFAAIFIAWGSTCATNPAACNSGASIIIKKIADIFRQAYTPAPKNLPAFPDAKPTRPKTPVQGGGGLRRRWKGSDGRIYEWDSQHGRVEIYDKRGRHVGEFDPNSGEQTKPATPGRKVKI
jgi:RHS repeat-associated protein